MATLVSIKSPDGTLIMEWQGLVPSDPDVPRLELRNGIGLLGAVVAYGSFTGTVGLNKSIRPAPAPGVAVLNNETQATVALAPDAAAEISTAFPYIWPTPPASGTASVRIAFQSAD